MRKVIIKDLPLWDSFLIREVLNNALGDPGLIQYRMSPRYTWQDNLHMFFSCIYNFQ